MCRTFNSVLAVTAVAGLGSVGFMKFRAPSIEGVWRSVAITVTGPGARTISPLQPNLAIITAKHYSRLEIHADGPRPALADPAKASAEELREVWGPVASEAGTYETSRGNVLTTHPVVAKNPAAMEAGSYTAYAYRLAGDTLWLTVQRNQQGPVPNPVTVKLTRVE
jgi:hypothetical protein